VAWGYNVYGQCDIPAPNAGFIGIATGGYDVLTMNGRRVSCTVETPDTSVKWWPAGRPQGGTEDLDGRHLTEVFLGLGLKADGSIVAWGANEWGQSDVPAPNTGFVGAAAGGYHSLGFKADGSIVAWGNNEWGQCSVPAPNAGFIGIAAGYAYSLALNADGSIVAWGDNSRSQCDVPAPNAGFVDIAARGNKVLGLRADGISISPATGSYGAEGGTGTIAVTAPSGRTWTAASYALWITITSGASGNGNGTVHYSVAANSGTAARSGTITAAGRTHTVTQAGADDGEKPDCVLNADCDDGNLCTTNTCIAGACVYKPVKCGDGLCDPATGLCVECLDHADCDDGDLCTTNPCRDGQCATPEEVECPAGEVCDPQTGECVEDVSSEPGQVIPEPDEPVDEPESPRTRPRSSVSLCGLGIGPGTLVSLLGLTRMSAWRCRR